MILHWSSRSLTEVKSPGRIRVWLAFRTTTRMKWGESLKTLSFWLIKPTEKLPNCSMRKGPSKPLDFPRCLLWWKLQTKTCCKGLKYRLKTLWKALKKLRLIWWSWTCSRVAGLCVKLSARALTNKRCMSLKTVLTSWTLKPSSTKRQWLTYPLPKECHRKTIWICSWSRSTSKSSSGSRRVRKSRVLPLKTHLKT